MTEYGRGPGSEPWHPEDPLYGDGGWGGQQTQAGRQSAYDGRPQQHHPQTPQYGDWNQEQQTGYDGQQHQHHDGSGRQYFDQRFAGHIQHHFHQGGWDATGTHGQVPYAADPGDPYGQQPVAYGGEQPDFYSTEVAYPPPEPPGRRREPEPEPDTAGEEEHAVVAGGGSEDAEEHELQSRRERRGKGKKPVKNTKRRTGCACMVVLLVFGGGLGGVGYFGYKFYQNRFAPAPDYVGDGNGETVTVDIPKGAGGYDIGRKLKEAGVVKSVDAFVSAQDANPNGKSLQDGIYTLQKEMSAASAVALMLSPKSRDNLIIPEGKRNAWVYAAIDSRLKLSKGTTANVAKKEWKELGLPSWANDSKYIKDPLEGFLYPSSYPVAEAMEPRDVLKAMVARASEQYRSYDLAGKARALGLDSPLQVLTVASLVQVEGKYKHDFGKVARVVYNRLKPDNVETAGRLEFDSTVNYLRGQSTLDVGSVASLRKINDTYNTYQVRGLPPGPISNPGSEAIGAALDPTPGPWYYFVSINENDTVFAVTNEEHNRNVEKYEKARKQEDH